MTSHTGRGRLSGVQKLLIHTSFQDQDNLPLLLATFFFFFFFFLLSLNLSIIVIIMIITTIIAIMP